MTEKPYQAKSLSGAQYMVRKHRRLISEMHGLLNQFDRERKLLARLAAETPQFSNPLEVYEAQKIRDRILSGITPTLQARGEGK